jgi:hypothetical protein
MVMAGVRLGTGGRKQHRGGQNGRREKEARKVSQANHGSNCTTGPADAERALS